MGVGGVNVHLVLRSVPGRTSRHDRVLRVLPRLARAGSTRDRAVCELRTAEASRQPAAFLLHGADRRQLAASLSRVAQVARWLSDAELTQRKARVPLFKKPMGTDETPLQVYAGALLEFHFNQHADQLAKIRKAVGLPEVN